MAQTRAVLSAWRQDYNTDRPHSKLGGRTPAEIAGQRGWGACPQPRCHHLNHQPSTQMTLQLSEYNQGSKSLGAPGVCSIHHTKLNLILQNRKILISF